MLWLSESDVRALLDPGELVSEVKAAFAGLRRERFMEPPSTRIDGLHGGESYMTVFPAHDRKTGAASAKLLAGRPLNAMDGRPEIDAIVALIDPTTATISALVSARWLTAMRTAATTAVALRAMLGERWRGRIGIVGCGAQGEAHARCLAAAGLAEDIVVASGRGDDGRARAFAEALQLPGGVAVSAGPLEEIAGRCRVLVTATLAARPLPLGALRGDLTLACIGPFLPDSHEIDPALCGRASLIVSDKPERLASQWIGTAVSDNLAPPRLLGLSAIIERPSPSTGLRLFFSDGRAIEDNVAARLVVATAMVLGRGLPLP